MRPRRGNIFLHTSLRLYIIARGSHRDVLIIIPRWCRRARAREREGKKEEERERESELRKYLNAVNERFVRVPPRDITSTGE